MADETKQGETDPQDVEGVEETAAFPWLFTPNYFFGFLLLGCLLLPGFRGCNGETVPTLISVVTPFVGFTGLPQFLAVVLLINTSVLCFRWQTEQKRIGAFRAEWLTNTTLAVLAFLASNGLLSVVLVNEPSWELRNWDDVLFWGSTILYGSAPLIGWLFVRFRAGSWFRKATLLQLWLALLSIASAMFYLPFIAISNVFYIGGKLNVIGVFGVVFASVVQLMDGQRSLHRSKGEPILQLTLKQAFVLMTLACVLTALGGAIFLVEPKADERTPRESTNEPVKEELSCFSCPEFLERTSARDSQKLARAILQSSFYQSRSEHGNAPFRLPCPIDAGNKA